MSDQRHADSIIEAIKKRPWDAVDTLRAISNYVSNGYFLPVIEATLLRHVYSRFLEVKTAIANLLGN